MIAQKKHENSTIAETIKLLQSGKWYGCSEIIEIAKGKNAFIRNKAQGREKIKRAWLMERSRIIDKKESVTQKILSWLSRKI